MYLVISIPPWLADIALLAVMFFSELNMDLHPIALDIYSTVSTGAKNLVWVVMLSILLSDRILNLNRQKCSTLSTL